MHTLCQIERGANSAHAFLQNYGKNKAFTHDAGNDRVTNAAADSGRNYANIRNAYKALTSKADRPVCPPNSARPFLTAHQRNPQTLPLPPLRYSPHLRPRRSAEMHPGDCDTPGRSQPPQATVCVRILRPEARPRWRLPARRSRGGRLPPLGRQKPAHVNFSKLLPDSSGKTC